MMTLMKKKQFQLMESNKTRLQLKINQIYSMLGRVQEHVQNNVVTKNMFALDDNINNRSRIGSIQNNDSNRNLNNNNNFHFYYNYNNNDDNSNINSNDSSNNDNNNSNDDSNDDNISFEISHIKSNNGDFNGCDDENNNSNDNNNNDNNSSKIDINKISSASLSSYLYRRQTETFLGNEQE